MSFIANNFSPVGSQARTNDAPAVHSYKSLDDLTAAIVDGYFNEMRAALKNNDCIRAVLDTGVTPTLVYLFVESAPKGLGAGSVVIVAGGTGYVVGDILTVQGGVSNSPCLLRVTSDAIGVIDGIEILDPGDYIQTPVNPVTVTGGTGGDDATFTLLFSSPDQLDVVLSALNITAA